MTGEPTGQVADRLDELVMSVAELLGVECVGLLMRDDVDRLRMVSSSGPAAAGLEHAQEITGVGPGPDAQLTGVPVAVTDVLAVAPYADLAPRVRGGGVRAVLSVPVLVGQEVVGNLNAVDPDPHPWSDRQHIDMQSFAALIADLLVLSAAGRGQDVPTLAGHLADVDGAPA